MPAWGLWRFEPVQRFYPCHIYTGMGSGDALVWHCIRKRQKLRARRKRKGPGLCEKWLYGYITTLYSAVPTMGRKRWERCFYGLQRFKTSINTYGIERTATRSGLGIWWAVMHTGQRSSLYTCYKNRLYTFYGERIRLCYLLTIIMLKLCHSLTAEKTGIFILKYAWYTFIRYTQK